MPSESVTQLDLNIFADYNSFEVRDAESVEDPATIDDTVEDLLRDGVSSGPGVVSVATARRMTVLVDVQVRADEPEDDSFTAWDHVVEASLELYSGQVMVLGGNESPSHAPDFSAVPGHYRMRVYFEGLETLSDDGIDGDDQYHVVLWPGSVRQPVVLKRCNDGALAGG